MSRKSGQRALDRLLAQPPGAREQDVGREPARDARAPGSRSATRRAAACSPPPPRPSSIASAALRPMKRCTVIPPGRPGVVELALERRAPAARAGSARAAGRAAPPAPRRASPSPRCARRLAHAADAPAEPLDRPRVAQHRDRGEPEREEERGQRRRTRGIGIRRRSSSSCRISTNAIVHSTPATDDARRCRSNELVISLVTPGDITLSSRIVPPPIAGDDVGREHDAGQQRRDLAPQVLARVERRGQLAERAHGVAAGALLDHDRRHQHRHLARGQPRAQRLAARPRSTARARSSSTTRLQLGAARVGELARGHRARACGIESPADAPLDEHPRRSPAAARRTPRCAAAAALDQRPRRPAIEPRDRRRPARAAARRSRLSTTQPSSDDADQRARSARPAASFDAGAGEPGRPAAARCRVRRKRDVERADRRCARSPRRRRPGRARRARRCGSCRPAAATARARRRRPRPAAAAARASRSSFARRSHDGGLVARRAAELGRDRDAGQHQPAQRPPPAAAGARARPRTRRSGPIGSDSNSITDASRNVSRRCEATTATSLDAAAAVGEAVDLDDHVDRRVDLVAQRLERDLQLAHRGQRRRAGGSRRRRSSSAA